MNILQFLPAGKISGIEKYAINLSKGLTKRGHKVIVLCSDNTITEKFKSNNIDCYSSIFEIFKIIKNEKIQLVNIQHRTALVFLVGY